MAAIVVHGGAGDWRQSDRQVALGGVTRAAERGWEILAGGGSALDAVAAAVVVLEDDPHFNAGTGSVLNQAGEIEMDASIMWGPELASGGVACITRVRNPILVARRVLETTDCVLLAGEHATGFARSHGFGEHNPITERRLAEWRTAHTRGSDGGTLAQPPGTVGAVALDRSGKLAAATSTGGRAMKPPGRVGDSPIPGAGNYANSRAAVSATGHGELMLRWVTARAIADRIEGGAVPEYAIGSVLEEMELRFGRAIGAICVDADGRVGAFHGTPAMPHAFRRDQDSAILARLTASPE